MEAKSATVFALPFKEAISISCFTKTSSYCSQAYTASSIPFGLRTCQLSSCGLIRAI
jgi:hypothetical protein